MPDSAHGGRGSQPARLRGRRVVRAGGAAQDARTPWCASWPMPWPRPWPRRMSPAGSRTSAWTWPRRPPPPSTNTWMPNRAEWARVLKTSGITARPIPFLERRPPHDYRSFRPEHAAGRYPPLRAGNLHAARGRGRSRRPSFPSPWSSACARWACSATAFRAQYGGAGLTARGIVAGEYGGLAGGHRLPRPLRRQYRHRVRIAGGRRHARGPARRCLPRLASGDLTGCFALTEPEAGSDATSLRTVAVRDGDHYRINGRKCFITNAPLAGPVHGVRAHGPGQARGAPGISAFLVERGTPGLSAPGRLSARWASTAPRWARCS